MDKLLKADYSHELFTIQIKVYKNGNVFTIENVDKDYDLTFQAIVGTLETIKFGYLEKQTEANKQEFKKQKKQS